MVRDFPGMRFASSGLRLVSRGRDGFPNEPLMNWTLVATIGIPSTLVVAGWFFAHWLTARRELATRRREARLKALEAAYMRLATSSNRELTNELIDKLETFVSEIQLYGTPKQIALMGEIVETFKIPGAGVPYDPILIDLRNTIRNQLQLEPVAGGVWWLRRPRKSSVVAEASPLVDSKNSDGATNVDKTA